MAGLDSLNRIRDPGRKGYHFPTAVGGEDDNGDISAPQILLRNDVLVICHEHVEAFPFGERQQFAVRDLLPAIRISRSQKTCRVQGLGKVSWHSFIKKYALAHG